MDLLIFVLSLFVSTSDAEALQRTAHGSRVTVEDASRHIAAARFAGAAHGVDPDIMLAIAWGESRYQTGVRGRDVGGRRACGALQVMGAACDAGLLGDYLAGARALRTWMDATRDMSRALTGYAGGYALLQLCERDPGVRACGTARRVMARARMIQRARTSSV